MILSYFFIYFLVRQRFFSLDLFKINKTTRFHCHYRFYNVIRQLKDKITE